MGYESVSEVRVGKFLEIKIDEAERNRAQSIANEMCEKLLANPVIEQYSVELIEQ